MQGKIQVGSFRLEGPPGAVRPVVVEETRYKITEVLLSVVRGHDARGEAGRAFARLKLCVGGRPRPHGRSLQVSSPTVPLTTG